MKFQTATLALSMVSSAGAALSWVKVDGNDLCAGNEANCDDIESCTKIVIGACTETTGPAPDDPYLSTNFVGLAFVSGAETYLTDATKLTEIEPEAHTDAKPNGYRDMDMVDNGNGEKYGFTMAGGRYGDMAVSGGYLGIASYLNTGTKTIEGDRVPVYTSTADSFAYTERGGSKHGAPNGPYYVCITDVGTDGLCGVKNRTFAPSEFKFSVFGGTSGADYKVKEGVTHVGARMLLKANNFEVNDLEINGNKNIGNIGSTGVNKIKLISGDKALTIDFPQNYNVGSYMTDGKFDESGFMTGLKTKQVKIKVSLKDAEKPEEGLFIDYLFEYADLNTPDKFFMYDPSITEAAAGNTGTTVNAGLASVLLAAAVTVLTACK